MDGLKSRVQTRLFELGFINLTIWKTSRSFLLPSFFPFHKHTQPDKSRRRTLHITISTRHVWGRRARFAAASHFHRRHSVCGAWEWGALFIHHLIWSHRVVSEVMWFHLKFHFIFLLSTLECWRLHTKQFIKLNAGYTTLSSRVLNVKFISLFPFIWIEKNRNWNSTRWSTETERNSITCCNRLLICYRVQWNWRPISGPLGHLLKFIFQVQELEIKRNYCLW